MRCKNIGLLRLVIGLMVALACSSCSRNTAKSVEPMAATHSGLGASESAKRSEALEFYYLRDVQDKNNPTADWRMDSPRNPGEAWIFTNPKGATVNSLTQPEKVLDKVVNRESNPPILTAADIVPNAKASTSHNGVPVVVMNFNERGTQLFHDFTRQHVDDYLAVFSDGRLLTAPMINEAIPGGSAEISGFKTKEEAQSVADRINEKPVAAP